MNDLEDSFDRMVDTALRVKAERDAFYTTLKWIADYSAIMAAQSDAPLIANINFGFREIYSRASGVLIPHPEPAP